MYRPVTIINIRSLSFSGTTWINLLLGCHPRAFALGPPDRVLKLLLDDPENAADACRVHADACEFWPRFFQSFDRKENFYLQLARAAQRDVIVVNNPVADGEAERSMRHPDILVRELIVVRDGRAIIASYLRYYPETDFTDAVRTWFRPSAAALPFDEQDPDALCVRYEDVAADLGTFMKKAGERFGLPYDLSAARYWEYEHHITAGNAGTIGVIRRANGQPFRGDDAAYRESRYEQIIASPERPPLDVRWKDDLDERARLIFDAHCGAINESWGYDRDRFHADAVRAFDRETVSSERPTNPAVSVHSGSDSHPHAATRKKMGLAMGGVLLLAAAIIVLVVII